MMGTLRSLTDWSGAFVTPDVLLGVPVRDGDWYVWDHPSIPSSIIDADGYIFDEVPIA